jgi:hypothetical protein
MQTISQDEFKKKYGESVFSNIERISPTPKTQGYSARELGQDIMQTGSDLKNTAISTWNKMGTIRGEMESGIQGDVRSILQGAGTIAGGASRAFGDVLKGGVKAVLPQEGEEALKRGIETVATPIVQSQPVQALMQRYESLNEKQKRDVDAVLGVGSLFADLFGIGALGKGGKAGVQVAKELGEQTLAKVPRITEKIGLETGSILKPKPTTLEATGQVLQGKTKDVAR